MAHATYTGEVWTDAHGFAAVELPSDADGRPDIELTVLADGVSAEVRGTLNRRRFTITTSEPHVKVAWKARAHTVARKEHR
jgi:hypothetical protein